MKPPELEKSV